MATFKEIMSGLKGLLKEKLNDTNLELFTEVDKQLDSLSEAHKKTEEDLSNTKDKVIEMVKSTSFKIDEEQSQKKDDTEEPMTIDEALETSIDEVIAKRPK